MVRVLAPTFEQHHDGFGIGVGRPRISWRFEPVSTQDVRDWKQTSYELQVGEETYRVQSSSSVLVPWPATDLMSRESIKVRVRCNATFTAAESKIASMRTDWSPWSVVEAGLLTASDWSASMICTKTSLLAQDSSLCPVLFTKRFTLPDGKITKARLYVTSCGVYEARLNGERIGDQCMAPGWNSYSHRMQYQVYDVAQYLEASTINTIGIEVGAGWYASALGWLGGRRCRYGNRLAVLVQLEITCEHGTIEVCSDSTWTYNRSGIVISEIYNGETLDVSARDAMKGWDSSPEFPDVNWPSAEATSFGLTTLTMSDAPPVRVTQVVQPVSIFKSKSGKTIIDFGQNLVGRLRVPLLKKSAGSTVTFRHAEVIEDGELGIRPLRTAKNTDTIMFPVNSDTAVLDWYPKFTFHGFRYVQVDGWSEADDPPLAFDSVMAEVMHTDFEQLGQFECSNEMLNKLHQNAQWSMRGNFLSLPTDCPQRDERLGWTGDIQVFAPTACFMYDVSGMLSSWLQDLAAEQAEEGRSGVPPLVVPSVIEKELKDDIWWPRVPQAVWGDATVLVPWALYQASVDVEILRRQFVSMQSWLDVGISRGPDGLWNEDIWQLGDWLDPNAPPDDPGDGRTDGTLVADTYLVHVTKIVSQIAKLLSHPDSARYETSHKDLKQTFQNKYMTPQGLIVGDTQTSLALAITFDLIDDPTHQATARARLSRLVRRARFKVSTGFAGTPIICRALSQAHLHDLAYRVVLNKAPPSWMSQIELGATTIWERWDSMLPDGSINPGEMTSFNHYALGSVVQWFYETVGGLTTVEPGWSRFQVKPVPGGGLRHASVSYKSPYGEIRVRWVVERDWFKLHLVVPPNSEAFVVLPVSGEAASLSSSFSAFAVTGGEPRIQNVLEDVKATGRWVGSGEYDFECPCETEK